MKAAELVALANEVRRRWPDASLAPNRKGNLNVLSRGTWVAFLDLQSGTIHTLNAAIEFEPC